MMTDNDQDQKPWELKSMARIDFDRARSKSFWRAVFSWNQNSNELLPFDEVRKALPLKGQHYAGLKQVPVDQIVGSVSRYQDFDRAFLPRQTHTRERWMSIDEAHLQDVNLPPVELYQIGSAYFVKDGNHRVSVAREKGQVFIDAAVIEVDVPVPIGPETKLDDLILKREQALFYEHTSLADIRPQAVIELTLPGQYEKLEEHIAVHRWYLGEQARREIDYSTAVASWYDHVYLPLVEIIRAENILAEFPGRTEADLYLWIIEHRWFLAEAAHDEISLKDAAEHFADQFSQRRQKRLARLLQSVLQFFQRKP
ncbi:MAG TPA: DUF4032 domain-containing protein [Anaerolineaceae bacterium]|nr:DUF4032 domain-containing protein [Anaerolineaceae bacterium]